MAAEEVYVVDDFTGTDVIIEDPDIVSVDVVDSHLAVSLLCVDRKRRVVHIPFQRSVQDKKLRLTIAQSAYPSMGRFKTDEAGSFRVPYMGKFETDETGQALWFTDEAYSLDFQKRPVLFSLDNKLHEKLSFWFKCRGVNPEVTATIYLDKIEIVPMAFSDDRDFAYILAVLVLLFFLLPGFLVYGMLFGSGEKERLLVWLTPLSILSFLVLYLVLYLGQQWSPNLDSRFLLIAYLAFNVLLVLWLASRKRLGGLAADLYLIRFELLSVFIVMLAVAAIVTKGMDLPLYTLTHERMRYLTYGSFGAHDPIFQYVNGIAILHNEPFSKYYSGYKLFFHVQDRAILGGVIYAVVRGIAEPFNQDVAYSYGLYTLFGSVLNCLALLPVFALHKIFWPGKQRSLLILFLIAASPFLISNFLLAWFKLAGAGLVTAGVVLLLLDKNSIRPWVMAGLLWGLAASFHPSLALALPIITLWLLYRYWRERRPRVMPALYAFIALLSVFAAVNAPWSVIKAVHYEDTNKLFREHFLGSQPYDKDGGMLGTLRNFADRFTLEEQVTMRSARLINSFRTEEIGSLIEATSSETWHKVLKQWNLIEAAYSVWVFAPLIILLVLSGSLTRLFPATAWDEPRINHTNDFVWLLGTQIATVFMIILVSFGKNQPDLTWNMPMSSLLMGLYLLVHANLAVGRIGAVIIVVYAAFTHYRLFFQYF